MVTGLEAGACRTIDWSHQPLETYQSSFDDQDEWHVTVFAGGQCASLSVMLSDAFE
jgi:hypothetical protein